MANPNLLPLLITYLIVSSLSLIIKCNADASKDPHEFSYEEGSPIGPKKWGALGAEFKSCSDGETQSPINIQVKKAEDQPTDLKMDYKEAPAKLFNKEHAVAVEWQGDAGGIVVNGSTYKLVQCHWHTPSEHTIDGKRYDAELHFVHSNDKQEKAVIGVFFAIGEPDPFIAKLSESKFKGIAPSGNDLGKVSANSTTSGSKRYFRYIGSLTTPPCSEGVTWTLAETVKTISEDQIKTLKEPLDHEFQENARPVQELHGRLVTKFEVKEGSGEETKHNGTVPSSSTSSPPPPSSTPAPSFSSSSSILQLRNGMMMLTHIFVLFYFLF